MQSIEQRSRKNGRYEEDGKVSYYQNGLLHREDGPAREYTSECRLQIIFDTPHHLDGPTYDSAKGLKLWYTNGLRHRENGPAVEWPNGRKEWFRDGKRHREDGPAIVYPDGRVEWWLDDVKYSPEKYLQKQQYFELNPYPQAVAHGSRPRI